MNALDRRPQQASSEDHAAHVSILAFRCAWHQEATRNCAVVQALRAYQDLLPDDKDAADKVVKALVDAIRLRPHWVSTEVGAEAMPRRSC